MLGSVLPLVALPESERSIRGDEVTDPRIAANAAKVLPLPKGEGWGEGEGTPRGRWSSALCDELSCVCLIRLTRF